MEQAQKKLGVAIFGLGRAGQIHLKNVVKDYTLSLLYVVDLLTDVGESLTKFYHLDDCKVLHPDQQQTVYDDARVDFVMVCSPTNEHEPIVVAALNAGKGVFCEKPIAADTEATARCYDTANRLNVPLFCSFNRRYDPSLRQVFNTRSKVGEIQMVKSCARDSPFPPLSYLRTSAGVFHDCLVHDIDLICWVVEGFPVEVFAAAHSFSKDIAKMDDVDTVAAVMKFASGVVAVIDTSRDSRYGYDQRLEVFGSNGMLINHNQRKNNLVFEGQEGAATGRIYESFSDRYEQSYIEALNHFKRVIRGEEKVEITKEITINIAKIASALEESSRTGKQISMVY